MLKFPLLRKFKRKKIKFSSFENGVEPQEIFIDSLVQKKEKELGIRERRLEVLLSKKILKIFFLFIFILIFVFFAKSFQMQIMENKKYSALAKENKFVSRLIQASRGVIYDSKGKQLVYNEQSFNLILDKKKFPSSMPKRNEILKEVSNIIGKNVNDLKNKIQSEQNQ